MSEPIIKLSHQAEVQLTAWAIATHGREFSGLGLIEKEGNTLHIIQVELLGVGSVSYTEFSFEKGTLRSDPRCKLWHHRHPVGNGKPGPHNWSGRDNQTAEREPFGVPAELVQWSCSIVLTPGGWVGRVDFYLPKLRTFHCAVEPNNPSEAVVIEASALIDENMRQCIDDLLREFEAIQRASRPFNSQFTADDFDLNEPIFDGAEMYCPECSGQLQELGTEDAGGVMDVTFFECLNCGGYAVLPDYHSCTPIGGQPKPKQQPAWKQSWWNVFGKR